MTNCRSYYVTVKGMHKKKSEIWRFDLFAQNQKDAKERILRVIKHWNLDIISTEVRRDADVHEIRK